MKLIRLTSDKAIFEINFNEDIIIPKGSQIALKNLSLKQFIPYLNINAKRDTMFSTIDSASVLGRKIILDEDKYHNTVDDIYSLMQDMENKLNSVLTLTGRELGVEWRILKQSNDKILIEYQTCEFDWWHTLYLVAGGVQFDVDDGAITNTTRTTNQTNKYYSPYKFIKGSGVFRARINNFVDNGVGDAGFEIGLSKVKPELWEASDTMTNAQRTFALIATENDEPYKFISNGGDIDNI